MGIIQPPWSSETYGFAIAPFLLVLLPFLLLCILCPIVLLRMSRLRLPPGPPAIPVVGHLHLISKNPHHSFCELSKRYGPLIFLRFGSVPVLVASSPDTARQILQKHDQIFSWRPRIAVSSYLFGGKDILFSQPGAYHKLLRQLAFSHLFGNKRLQSFRPIISSEIRQLLCNVSHASNNVFVREKLYESTFSIISAMVMGESTKKINFHSPKGQSLVAALLEVVDLVGAFNVGDYFPLLATLDLQGYEQRSKAVSQILKVIFGEVIHERRNDRENRDNKMEDEDFLDALITVSSDQKDVPITDSHLVGILTDIFAGGIDTSAATIEWALAELLKHPKTLKKVQDELSLVVGSTRLVFESDVENLPYLRAVVKEAMRVHPVAPLLLPHAAREQCQVYGYGVPSGTLVYINVWAIGRDPTVWGNPLEFYPERFLQSNINFRGQHFELLPFGSGRRVCPGLALGISNVYLMLANLLHVFDWVTLGEMDLKEKFSSICKLADPLVAKVKLRVPRYLIEENTK
ncbi:hypothetical protein KP509_16G042500 [Ceratopteris richardii]|uniref:Cytochrome P450 n=1 Tax=Ceratopteris richardii TaxID=49495 RepID=A0A8T2T2G9_CERRI|nr:hypothetical protein KP509_16G042500 [Ceratopteris richardii]